MLEKFNEQVQWMRMRATQRMFDGAILALFVFLVSMVAMSTGCGVFAVAKDKGAFYLEFGTRVEVGSEASKTHGEEVYAMLQVRGPGTATEPPQLGTIAEEKTRDKP